MKKTIALGTHLITPPAILMNFLSSSVIDKTLASCISVAVLMYWIFKAYNEFCKTRNNGKTED